MNRVPKQPVWWMFLRITEDGWASEFSSVSLLLEHLKRRGGFESSREDYCYNLWLTCLWVTEHLKKPETLEKLGLSVVDHEKFNLWDSSSTIGPDKLVSLAKEKPDVVARLVQSRAGKYNAAKSVCYAKFIIAINRTFFKVNKTKLDLQGFP
jgi:hypothetical protein